MKKELKVAADVGRTEEDAGHTTVTVASEESEEEDSSSGEESEDDGEEQGEGSQDAESEEDGVDNLGEKLIRFKSPNLMNQMLPHAIAQKEQAEK